VNITGFNPTTGDDGTQVTLSLTGMPPDADDGNTSVVLSGDSTVTVDDVTVAANGDGTIDATLEANSQSGEFAVIINSPSQGWVTAQSAGIFTVNAPAGEPLITNMNPRTAIAGQTPLTLTGQNLNEIQYARIGNVAVMAIQHPTDTMIRLMVPASTQSGQQRVSGQSQQYGRVNCPYMLTVQ
jgi:hypothetical protein